MGIGDWSRQNGCGFLKGGVGHSPNKKFLKELKQRGAIVVLIDEYKTSKCCYECHQELVPVRLPCFPRKKERKKQELKEEGEENIKTVRTVHQILRCSNNECSMIWNRDVCKSLNHILLSIKVVTGQERPYYLQRKLNSNNLL